MSQVDVYLLTGFLGSGKTTLLKVLLSHVWQGRSAVVVNEFGSIGIDGEEVRREKFYDVVEIRGGCVCCLLQGQFLESFRHLLKTLAPERIFVEASGVSDPAQVLDALQFPPIRDRIGQVVVITVVDATFFGNREFLGSFYDKQIARADIILLNKIDCVAPGELEEVETSLEFLNPAAIRFRTSHCNVDPEVLVDSFPAVGDSRSGQRATEAGGLEVKPEFHTFSIELPAELSVPRLEEFLERCGGEILRMKGTAHTENGPVSLNFSAHGLDLRPSEWSEQGIRLVFVLGGDGNAEVLRAELLQILSG